MSITNELREFIAEQQWCAKGTLSAIADRIDEGAKDNELFRREAEPFCDRLREAAAERADVTLFGVDYVALPMDADGVPIHVGDMVEYLTGGRDVVRFITLNGSGWAVNERGWEARTMRHHHTPTVEDVLTEFGISWEYESDCEDRAALLKEYAAKLRLAEEVDE
jgi:hypothetical protein